MSRAKRTRGIRRIVLTGGPGGGKTAVLETMRRSLCPHVAFVRESASIVLGGGFPREPAPAVRRAAQRAIFFVQRELEHAAEVSRPLATICDRGTLDGSAYWIGDGPFCKAVGTTLEQELAHYSAVVHLRVPTAENGYNHDNPLRVESAAEAAAIDEAILRVWSKHPRRYVVDATDDFLAKVKTVLEIVQRELPECFRDDGTTR